MALNLLDVNNDCLLEIFKYLSDLELASVASTCTRFQTIARDVFSSRHKSNCVQITVIDIECCRELAAMLRNIVGSIRNQRNDSDIDVIGREFRRQTAGILRNFGDLIKKLEITFCEKKEAEFCNRFVFNLMVTYCTEMLERLKLVDCKALQLDRIIDARALFRNVNELILDESPAIKGCFLSDAKQLTRLDLMWLTDLHALNILSNDFPNLQSLTLNNTFLGEIDVISFLKRHPDLIELELRKGDECDLSLIGECNWLRKLTIWDCDDCDMSPIAALDKLISLKLSSSGGRESIMKLLTESKSSQSAEELVLSYSGDGKEKMITILPRFPSLKELALTVDDVDDALLSDVYRLKNLRVLSMGGRKLSLTSNGLVNLVRRLPHLEQLCFQPDGSSSFVQLKQPTYLQICEICRSRNQKLVIFNFDSRDEMYEDEGRGRKEPFAEYGQQEFVQFIALDDYLDEFGVFEI